MDSGTKLTVKNATGAKTSANPASRRSESNGRRPGPRIGKNPGNKKLKLDFDYPSNPGTKYNPGTLPSIVQNTCTRPTKSVPTRPTKSISLSISVDVRLARNVVPDVATTATPSEVPPSIEDLHFPVQVLEH